MSIEELLEELLENYNNYIKDTDTLEHEFELCIKLLNDEDRDAAYNVLKTKINEFPNIDVPEESPDLQELIKSASTGKYDLHKFNLLCYLFVNHSKIEKVAGEGTLEELEAAAAEEARKEALAAADQHD